MEILTSTENYIYNPINLQSKKLMRAKIAEIWTPEFKRQCKGLAIVVLSKEEYNIVLNALNEVNYHS